MIRSILCVSGHRCDHVLRAFDEPADMVLLDLEDSVPEDRKHEARQTIKLTIQANQRPGALGPSIPRTAVRVNGVESPEFDLDMSMLKSCRFSGWLWLPKVESPGDLEILDRVLGFVGDPATQQDALEVKVCALIESPAGMAAMAQLEVDGLAFGRHDFLAAAGISERQDALVEHAQLQMALAARAAGIPCWDAPCYRGDDYFATEVDFALRAGFTGKGCLSPAQIRPVNDAFAVPDSEISRALVILEAARSTPEAVAKLAGGELLAPPVIRWAQMTLARAAA